MLFFLQPNPEFFMPNPNPVVPVPKPKFDVSRTATSCDRCHDNGSDMQLSSFPWHQIVPLLGHQILMLRGIFLSHPALDFLVCSIHLSFLELPPAVGQVINYLVILFICVMLCLTCLSSTCQFPICCWPCATVFQPCKTWPWIFSCVLTCFCSDLSLCLTLPGSVSLVIYIIIMEIGTVNWKLIIR